MTLIKKILRFVLIRVIYPAYYLIYETLRPNYIVVSTSIKPFRNNWGDDVSVILCKLINPQFKYIPRCYTWNVFKKDDVLCIGSILTWMSTPSSIVWGSGVLYPDAELSAIPKKVSAVRGPLTREYLLQRGIDCPAVYGDPALLFPRYYKPKMRKEYKLGIIPHFRDKRNPIVSRFQKDKSVLVIDVEDVLPWTKFIDNICSCECIASSSLHGVILSDAYNIPNIWISFPNGERKEFAFMDYFCSVGKDFERVYNLCSTTQTEEIVNRCHGWKPANINTEKLLECCPFNAR